MRLRPIGLLIAAALALLAACGRDRFIVVGTAQAPSTSGFVEIEDDGEPAELLVHLEHLHAVERLDATKRVYAVWLDSGTGAPVYAGNLSYDPGQRIGELRVQSPYRKFIVKITAEAEDQPTSPGELVVATQEVALDD